MSDRSSDRPATDAGRTRAAGDGVGARELAAEVARQTSPDLLAEPVFEQETDGAATETAADKATAEDLRD